MILYTIQHKNVLDQVLKTGCYKASMSNIMEESFKESYEWMIGQANKKIKNWNNQTPIWAWTKKPDLRKHRFIIDETKEKIQDFVLITLNVPDDIILLSHFGLWHFVLNDFPLTLNNNEELFFDNLEITNPKEFNRLKMLSWEKILRLPNEQFSIPNWNEDEFGDENDLQAIFPFLKKEMIQNYKNFSMKNRAKNDKKIIK